MKHIRKLLASVLAIAMLCGMFAGSAFAASKDTLNVALGGEPTSLDPQGSSGMNDRRVCRQIYETLVTQDQDMNIQPGLATSWEYTDDTTIVFHLRENVKWHNGESFTAADVLYSLNRCVNSSYTKSYSNMIDLENTVATDDYTVVVKLKQPYAPILANLAFTALSITNQKAVEEGGEQYGRNPVGTGPFKFIKWVAGDRIELEVFDEYWGEKPAFSKMNIRIISESANRSIELETGGVDIAYELSTNDIGRIEDNPDTRVERMPSFAVTFIGFNCDESSVMSDKRLRQAVAYALDTVGIVNVVYYGAGQVATGPIPSSVWGYSDEVGSYDYDVEKAKALIAETGIATPISVKLYTNETTERQTIAEIVKNQLGQIGIAVEIVTVEQATYLATVEAKEEDMYILSWTTVTGDADFGMYTQYTSGSFGASGNRCYYYSPEADEALGTGRSSTDNATRLEAYKKAQQIIVEDVPAYYLWQGESLFGLSSRVQGFVNMPNTLVSLAGITFAD